MSSAPVAPFAEALTEFSSLVRGVRDDQWDAPTPCPDWTVRDLINHMAGGHLLISPMLDGAPRPEPEEIARRRSIDFLGAEPVASFDASADRIVEAFSRPGALEQPMEMPLGVVPGATVLDLRLTETIVHGWDLATATGQAAQFSDESIAQALAFSRRALADLPPGNRAFGPAVTPPNGVTPLHELVSLLGRDCSWAPSQS